MDVGLIILIQTLPYPLYNVTYVGMKGMYALILKMKRNQEEQQY